MSVKIKIYFFLLLITAPSLVFGQRETPKSKEKYRTKMERFRVKKKDFKKYRYYSAGGSFDLLTYFGDLAPTDNLFSTDISQIHPGVSAFIRYQYGPRMSLKAELLYGRLTGDDFIAANSNDSENHGRYIRNLSFRNDILEFSLMAQFFIFKNYLDSKQRKFFNIYLSGGLGVLYSNPKAKVPYYQYSGERYGNYGEWVALRPLGTEGQHSEYYDLKPYSAIQLSIPFGGGFQFRLSDKLDFAVDINYRWLLTDYIDDVSGNYVDLGALENDMAVTMSDRSREEYSVMTGEKRDISDVTIVNYVSEYNGDRYTVFQGYGQQSSTAVRGGPGKDSFLVMSFKISYILNKTKAGEH
jgi:hypothetical protein